MFFLFPSLAFWPVEGRCHLDCGLIWLKEALDETGVYSYTALGNILFEIKCQKKECFDNLN